MKHILGFLQLRFLPASVDFSLFVLRVWLGLTMAINHGWGKLTGFSGMAEKFPDFVGIGSTASLAVAVLGELVCSVLIVLGFGTRFAALGVGTVMAFAFFGAHGAKLSGPGSGELAFVYLAGFVAILLAGPGKWSLDAKLGAKV